MTGKTRDYFADLANRKGMTFPGQQDDDQAKASANIEWLLTQKDAEFEDLDDKTEEKALKKIENVVRGLSRWTFAE